MGRAGASRKFPGRRWALDSGQFLHHSWHWTGHLGGTCITPDSCTVMEIQRRCPNLPTLTRWKGKSDSGIARWLEHFFEDQEILALSSRHVLSARCENKLLVPPAVPTSLRLKRSVPKCPSKSKAKALVAILKSLAGVTECRVGVRSQETWWLIVHCDLSGEEIHYIYWGSMAKRMRPPYLTYLLKLCLTTQ